MKKVNIRRQSPIKVRMVLARIFAENAIDILIRYRKSHELSEEFKSRERIKEIENVRRITSRLC